MGQMKNDTSPNSLLLAKLSSSELKEVPNFQLIMQEIFAVLEKHGVVNITQQQQESIDKIKYITISADMGDNMLAMDYVNEEGELMPFSSVNDEVFVPSDEILNVDGQVDINYTSPINAFGTISTTFINKDAYTYHAEFTSIDEFCDMHMDVRYELDKAVGLISLVLRKHQNVISLELPKNISYQLRRGKGSIKLVATDASGKVLADSDLTAYEYPCINEVFKTTSLTVVK